MLADSVGLALLVVLGALEPAERVAFVLHDMFAVPFDEIALILGRSPAAGAPARQPRPQQGAGHADRARGRPRPPTGRGRRLPVGVARRRLRGPRRPARPGRRVPAGRRPGCRRRSRSSVARRPSPSSSPGGPCSPRTALVDGRAGIVVAPRGQLLLLIGVTFRGDRIADPRGDRRSAAPRRRRPSPSSMTSADRRSDDLGMGDGTRRRASSEPYSHHVTLRALEAVVACR